LAVLFPNYVAALDEAARPLLYQEVFRGKPGDFNGIRARTEMAPAVSIREPRCQRPHCAAVLRVISLETFRAFMTQYYQGFEF
jgi:hypothetical protein